MEKHLFNFAYIPQEPIQGLEDTQKLEAFLKEFQLDGVEMMLYDSSIDNSSYINQVIGAHLKYWPCWMPLYEKDKQLLNRLYKTPANLKSYYGAPDYEGWLEQIRQNIRAALRLEPEYLVWHVADCTVEEAFSFKFSHNNKEVLQATVEIVKEVINEVPQNVKLLLENLWWPGLTLTEPREVAYLLDNLGNYNIGLILDTGHLLNKDTSASTEAEAIQFLLKKISALGSLKEQIKGVHLNLSLSAAYRNSHKHSYQGPMWSEQVVNHIHAIDQHRAFSNLGICKLLELIKPQYINHELYFYSKNDLTDLLQMQLKACGR